MAAPLAPALSLFSMMHRRCLEGWNIFQKGLSKAVLQSSLYKATATFKLKKI